MGHLYGARTTPHMFVIDPKGDPDLCGRHRQQAFADPDDIATATNYVTAALDEAMAGKPVTTPTAAAVWLLGEVREQLRDGG